jgi:molybdate transport system ATP-binding protein
MSFSLTLRHRFPGASLDIAFDVASPGVTVLFGPSGAGKSTIVNAAAGLLRPDFCRICSGGLVLADTEAGIWLPPEKRRAGLVFQDSRLFPHMSVASNLRYGMRRAPPGDIGFGDIVDLLGIGALLDRRPNTLSGGERQRVAIGRALLAQPRLLLMDEPLASLDAARKAEILPFLARLKTTLNLPVIYVTHALDEAMRLGDSVVLLESGQVAAYGPLQDVAARADLPLARREDAGAVLTCLVAEHDPGRQLTRLDGCGASFWIPLTERPEGSACRIRIPAREIILATRPPEGISLHNIVAGTVRVVQPDTGRRSAMVAIALPSGGLLARVTLDAVQKLSLVPGAPVLALIKSTSIELL